MSFAVTWCLSFDAAAVDRIGVVASSGCVTVCSYSSQWDLKHVMSGQAAHTWASVLFSLQVAALQSNLIGVTCAATSAVLVLGCISAACKDDDWGAYVTLGCVPLKGNHLTVS